jgi:hypothetical protein
MSPEPDVTKAEAHFCRALAIAHQQQAKSLELRAAMSMVRLWRDQGKRRDARDLLAPIYGWFTEGFDTLDLKEAKGAAGSTHSVTAKSELELVAGPEANLFVMKGAGVHYPTSDLTSHELSRVMRQRVIADGLAVALPPVPRSDRNLAVGAFF